MKKRGWKGVLKDIGPLIVALALQPFIQGEVQYTIVIVAVLLITFKIKYYKGEWTLFLVGAIISLLFEMVGGLYYRTQFWADASLFGIPIWLPILWGYGFVMIGRFRKYFVKE